MSTLPSVSRQISSAVVLRWMAGLAGIGKLLQDDAVRDLGGQFLGLGNGALHALRPFRQDDARAEDLEELAALGAHRLRHGQDELEALGGGDEGQRDAGVAAGRLDQDAVLGDLAGLDGLIDHREADAVLDAREGVEEFQLEQDLRLGAVGGRGAVQAHEGGVADGLGDVVVYLGHDLRWLRL
jgi:hypothetical protein